MKPAFKLAGIILIFPSPPKCITQRAEQQQQAGAKKLGLRREVWIVNYSNPAAVNGKFLGL
jgi:hypothetical protein